MKQPSIPILLASAGLVISGCRPRVVEFIEFDTGVFPAPRLWLDPDQLDFEPSTDEQFGTVAIHNLGDSKLRLDGIELVGDEAFSLQAHDLPTSLAAGGRTELVVRHVTDEDYASAQIRIQSDDPDTPLAHVFLAGEPLLAELYITPESYDFGTVSPGCEVDQDLVLINLGEMELEIQTLQYSTDNQWLRLSSVPELPAILKPGEAATVTVTFQPDDEGQDSGVLQVFSTAPDAIATSSQTGESDWEWVQADGLSYRPVDMVLLLDQSGTMNDDLSRVAEAMEDLVEGLNASGVDWQLAVVAAESGCYHGEIVTSDTEDPPGSLGNYIRDHRYGGWDEKLLRLLYNAMLRRDEDDCNAGLFRDDAILHGVVITDEPHQDTEPAAYWVDELRELLDEDARLIVSAVAGDVPEGCAGASPGVDYDDAVDLTGGLFLSLCDELDRVGELATTSQRAVVPLNDPASADTVSVKVDGVEWTDGWHLDQDDTRVVFDTQPAGEVEVLYAVEDCDGEY